jgi:MFS family permease
LHSLRTSRFFWPLQLLGGISAAAVTVLTILVVSDLTTGTGRFNLVRGFIGTLIAIAASISTTATGFLFEALGNWQGFLILAAASAIATGVALGGNAGDKARQISRLIDNICDLRRQSRSRLSKLRLVNRGDPPTIASPGWLPDN